MIVLSIMLKVLSSKWTYVTLFILTVIITCSIFIFRIRAYENKIRVLNDAITQLEITNTVLYKDNLFKDEKLKILKSFSNSTSAIEKITDEELSYEEKEAVNAISNDFYNYFNTIRMSND